MSASRLETSSQRQKKSSLGSLERAKEILSARGALPSDEDTVFQALEILIEKKDPVRKAERAAVRAGKKASASADPAVPHGVKREQPIAAVPHGQRRGRLPIPAAVMHAATLRDGGRCSFPLKNGSRCGSRVGIQFDHDIPVAHSGGNTLENINLRCREHNIMAAVHLLGAEVMKPYQ